MKHLLLSLLLLVNIALLGCGGQEPSASVLHSAYPDNYPVKSQCWGADRKNPSAALVDYDDQADIRLCAALQKDGHLGLDIRYRGISPRRSRMYAVLSIKDARGQSRQGLFPMSAHAFPDVQTLNLSDGCIAGSYDGCVTNGTGDMRQLVKGLNLVQGSAILPFQVAVGFIALRDAGDFDLKTYEAKGDGTYHMALTGF